MRPLISVLTALAILIPAGAAWACNVRFIAVTIPGTVGFLGGVGFFILLCQMTAYGIYRLVFRRFKPHHEWFIYPGLCVYAWFLSSFIRFETYPQPEYTDKIILIGTTGILCLALVHLYYSRFRKAAYDAKMKEFFLNAYPGILICACFLPVTLLEMKASLMMIGAFALVTLPAHFVYERIMRSPEERRRRKAFMAFALVLCLMFAVPNAGHSYSEWVTNRPLVKINPPPE